MLIRVPLLYFLSIILAMLGVLCCPSASAAEGADARVLFINSYNRGYSWSDGIEEGLRQRFSDQPVPVSASVIIFTLKIFDVVLVMTGGQYDTDVIATQFYNQYFVNRNFGLGSAIAIVLLLTVVPVMVYNLRQFNKRETL